MELNLQAIRQALPALEACVYLNTGTFGPLPRRSVEAMQAMHERQLTVGRIDAEYFPSSAAIRDDVRAALAELLHCDVSEVAITQHTTHGMNIGVLGFAWQAGDEVVTTTGEHPGLLLPLASARERYGVSVRFARWDPQESTRTLVSRIEEQITARTRMIAMSHVCFATGAVADVEAVATLAHRRGLVLVVDGAQSGGALDLDLPALGADVYGIPGQKWLLGPEGTGGTYVGTRNLSLFRPSFIGFFASAQSTSMAEYLPQPGARRFEVGTQDAAALAAQRESLRWLLDDIGIGAATRRIHEMAALAIAELERLEGIDVITPKESHAGLVSFRVGGLTADEALARVLQEGVVVRTIPALGALRASFGFYTSEADIERFIDAVRKAASR